MKNYLVSKNQTKRLDFIRNIKGRKIAIYNKTSELLHEFDLCIDMNKLMKEDYYLENLAQCNGETTVVLIDVLVKHGIYVHPYGKIFSFCEQAKQTLIIDTFAFKWDEKQIVRPFLFINPSILGSSMINFFEGKENIIENYYLKIKKYIEMDVDPIEIEVIKYEPNEQEINNYEALKKRLIIDEKQPKTKIVTELIKYVDTLNSKIDASRKTSYESILISSNKPKNKFWIYDVLQNEKINKITFLSSGIFGADEIELNKTKNAIERHNILIHLLNGNKKL